MSERMSLEEYRRIVGSFTQAKCSRSVKSKRDQDTKSPAHPQSKLAAICKKVFGDDAIEEEYRPLSERRFRIDVAIPQMKIGIELDGYSHHGLSKKGFHADRERDRVLMINGWRIFRFTAREINQDCLSVEEFIMELGRTDGMFDVLETLNKSRR